MTGSKTLQLGTMAVLLAALGLGALAQPAAPRDSLAILVDGSSTVGPITEAAAVEFLALEPRARISVAISGTGGGFRRFVAHDTDINNASRPIRPAEMTRAAEAGIQYLELLIGLDGVVVAVDLHTRIFQGGVPVLTLGELELLWSRESEGLITRWSQISPRLADAPIVLSGGAATSGTTDVLTEIVSGRVGDIRADYFGTEEDQLLAEKTGEEPFGLTFFGFAYLEHNRDRVQAVALDPRRELIDTPAAVLAEINARRAAAGKRPLVAAGGTAHGVLPTVDTIADFVYPISRPLFFYVNLASAPRPLLDRFVTFYLSEEVIGNPEFMRDVGYVPASPELREASRRVWREQIVGTAFGGTITGLTAEDIARLYRAHAKSP